MAALLKNRYLVLAMLAAVLVVQVYETSHIHSCCWQIGRAPLGGHNLASHDGHNCGAKFWTASVYAPRISDFACVARLDMRAAAALHSIDRSNLTAPRAPPPTA